MMQRIPITGLVVAATLLFASASAATAQTQKFGYINSQRILAQAPGASEAQRAFESEMSTFRTQVDSLEQSIERAQEQFQRQQATLSEQARRERQQALQQQFSQYQQRVGELEQMAQRRQQELVQPIMKRISEVIEEIRKEGSYAIIFDAATGSLITADPAYDLTERVLERLRS